MRVRRSRPVAELPAPPRGSPPGIRRRHATRDEATTSFRAPSPVTCARLPPFTSQTTPRRMHTIKAHHLFHLSLPPLPRNVIRSNLQPLAAPRHHQLDSSTDLREFSRLPTRGVSNPGIQKKSMGHDEAVVTQKSGKAPSPPKDQPALYPCLDWSTMQAYYGPGILPPTYFGPGIAPGHAPPQYMLGPQPLLPSALGKSYTAIYPHGGGFSHPFMPLMVNPLSAEPAKSVNSKENSLTKKLKEIDGTAASTDSGNNEKTSGGCSVGGSSDGNNQKASGTPKKRRVDAGPISGYKKALHYSPGAETGGTSAANDIPGEPGRLTTLPNLRIPDTAIKPNASTASDFSVIGTTISTEFQDKDDRESKCERRKQSNRESARRSRLRKQAETEELAKKVELLTAENTSLRREMSRLTESSKKLRSENSALMEKLTDAAADQAQEVSPDQTIAQSARVLKNFMSMIDNTSTSRSTGHMEHGAPKLRQLLGTGLATDAVAAR